MSFRFTNKVYAAHNLKISVAQGALLSRIADRANDEGIAWMGIRSLARDCQFKSVGHVSKLLNQLINRRILIVAGKTPKGTRLLQLNAEALEAAADERAAAA